MSDESFLAQLSVRFDTTANLERDNPVLDDGELCAEITDRKDALNMPVWHIKKGAYRNGTLARWGELPYFDTGNLPGFSDIIIQINAAIAAEAAARQNADTAHAALGGSNGVHGASSAAVAGQIVTRDGAGRAKVAPPSAEDDIALKATVTAEAAARENADTALHSEIAAEAAERENADSAHAALTNWKAHAATRFPRANRIALYGPDKKLHTGAPATVAGEVVEFTQIDAALARIADLEVVADDVFVTREGDFLVSRSGVLFRAVYDPASPPVREAQSVDGGYFGETAWGTVEGGDGWDDAPVGEIPGGDFGD
jgi:hypothetical protein